MGTCGPSLLLIFIFKFGRRCCLFLRIDFYLCGSFSSVSAYQLTVCLYLDLRQNLCCVGGWSCFVVALMKHSFLCCARIQWWCFCQRMIPHTRRYTCGWGFFFLCFGVVFCCCCVFFCTCGCCYDASVVLYYIHIQIIDVIYLLWICTHFVSLTWCHGCK